MRVGIHKNFNGKFHRTLEVYEEILEYNGIEHVRLETDDSNFMDRVRELDLFIFRWHLADSSKQIAKSIMPVIEKESGIKCFPDVYTSWHYDDKIKQYYLMKSAGFPVIDSYIFWNRSKALYWIKNQTFPLIFKLKSGSASHNVVKIESQRQGRRIIRKMFGRGFVPGTLTGVDTVLSSDTNIFARTEKWAKNKVKKMLGEEADVFWQINRGYVLFQDFLEGNDYDTRVVVIGNRAFAFRRFNRPGDFRASGSSNKDLDPEKIDRDFLRISFEVSAHFNFQCMAYDFIYDQDKRPRIVEMSYSFPDRTIPLCPGFWDEDMNWHTGHFWPQYCQLQDLLGLKDLKQPDIRKE